MTYGLAGLPGPAREGEWMSWSCYRRLWWASVLTTMAYGFSGAFRHLSVAELLLIGGGMATQGVIYGWLVWGGGGAPHPRTGTLGAALSCAVLTLSVLGLGFLQGWGSVVTGAALCLAGLPLRYRRRRCAVRDESVAVRAREPVGPPEASSAEGLSTAELCSSWQITSAALQGLDDAGHRQVLVELRGRYLDELERRDPQAFRRWFTRARTGKDPTPFFSAAARR